MNLFGPLSRAVILVGMVMGAMVAPALAAPADLAYLSSYFGNYKGRGTMTGAAAETVVCRMSLQQGNGEKLNYAGRCSLAGNQLSVTGSIAYNDDAHHYEAAMTSNAGFSGTAVGVRQGDTVVFNLKERDSDTDGNDMTITSRIILSGGKIGVDFNVVFNSTGEGISAKVPFTKS